MVCGRALSAVQRTRPWWPREIPLKQYGCRAPSCDTSSPACTAPAEAGVRGKKILQDRVRKHAELDRVWSFLVARHDGLERVEAKILREVQQRALQLLQGVQREMAQRVVAAAAARADDGDGWRGNGNGAGAVGHR